MWPSCPPDWAFSVSPTVAFQALKSLVMWALGDGDDGDGGDEDGGDGGDEMMEVEMATFPSY